MVLSVVTLLYSDIRYCSANKLVKFSTVIVDKFKNCSSYFSQVFTILVEALGNNPLIQLSNKYTNLFKILSQCQL